MSKARAARRAEREEAQAQQQAAQQRRRDRQLRRAAVRQALVSEGDGLRRRFRWRGQRGILARRRRRQNAVIVGLYLVSQILLWLITDDPWWRVTGALITLLSVPVLVTLVLDRRR